MTPDIPVGSPHYRAAVENRFAGDARFTEATLAVAYEARTRNLLALAALWNDLGDRELAGNLIVQAAKRL